MLKTVSSLSPTTVIAGPPPSDAAFAPQSFLLNHVLIIDAERRLHSLHDLSRDRPLYAIGALMTAEGREEMVETTRIASWSIYYDRHYTAMPVLKLRCHQNLYECQSAAPDYQPWFQQLMTSARITSKLFNLFHRYRRIKSVRESHLREIGLTWDVLYREWGFIMKEVAGLADRRIANHPAFEFLAQSVQVLFFFFSFFFKT